MSEKCSNCGEEGKPHSKGQRWCKDCMKAYMKTWRANNRSKIRASDKAWMTRTGYVKKQSSNGVKAKWRANNPDKVRQSYKVWRDSHLEQEKQRIDEWQNIWEEFDGLCFWCEGQASSLEHIVPITPKLGGQQGHHTKGNVVPACIPCNSRKLNKDPLVFLFEMREHGKMQSV